VLTLAQRPKKRRGVAAAENGRTTFAIGAEVSPAAKAKAASRKTADGQPVHSFRTLPRNLGTLTRNTVRVGDAPPVTMLAKPTLTQQEVFAKLGVPLAP
jgi:hypothetical protein